MKKIFNKILYALQIITITLLLGFIILSILGIDILL